MINSNIIQKLGEPSDIKDQVNALVNKRYKLSFIPEKIIYISNGIKYYYIEVECNDDSKFIINAYGTEAEYLFKEVHKCIICGKSINEKNKDSGDGRELIRYEGRGLGSMFVESNCINLLKKFEIAYGKEFFVE